MDTATTLPYSVLDLSPIVAGGTPADSFRNSLDLARHAERWGYHRFWLAEHHNIPSVASAATAVLIGHVAGGTSRIRVGSGGVMLPNHAPLVIAEQFGTLESLYPGRVDLGVGRAPGGDQRTARALRRGLTADTFPDDLRELMAFFQPPRPRSGALAQIPAVRAIPGEGLNVPIYLLGSSDFSARLAAELGLPFAFASHFAPDHLHLALELYRSQFQPSAFLARPHAMVGVNVFAADTDAEARRLFTSLQRQFLALVRGVPGPIQPAVESMEGRWTPVERVHVERMTRYSVVGSLDTVERGLREILSDTQADEIIVTASIPDHAARLRSFEIAAEAFARINRRDGSSPGENQAKDAKMTDVHDLAARHGFTADAVSAASQALDAGGGRSAQFDHPEFGGRGQWMPGMAMIGEMSNAALRARVAALFEELARPPRTRDVQPTESPVSRWYPAELGEPSASGGQNGVRYAFFPQRRRLAVESEAGLAIYDTADHQITRVGQRQSGEGRDLAFTSQHGLVPVDLLERLGKA